MKLKRILTRLGTVAVVVALVAGIFGTASVAMANGGQKSLYVITDLNAPTNIPIDAYAIQGTGLLYQWTGTIPDRNGGAVGLGIDSVAEILFATFEVSGTLDIVDATNMNRIGQVTAPAATNLAGIVVDEGKQKLYAVDRGTNHLYSYKWHSGNQTLELENAGWVPLPSASSLYGIALDEVNDRLYVGDSTTTVKAYNTSDWSLAGQFTMNNIARGIGFDEANQTIYTANGGPGGGTKLTKFAISNFSTGTGTETIASVNSTTLGVAVDQATGLVYITTYGGGTRGDRLLVYDGPNLTTSSVPTWSSSDLGNPTGLAIPRGGVSYNPLNLSKDDGLGGAGVIPGASITYTISYDNVGNNNPVTGVVIVETLPPEVSYVSSTGGGSYLAGSPETVTWNIGTVAAGASSQSVRVTVQVKPGTAPGTTITDTCSINSNETGQAWANEETLVNREGEIPPEQPGIVVGGDVYPVNRLAILAPWIALAAVIIAGATMTVRRRRVRS